jgi:iron(III) transport system permease protein
VTLAPRRPGAVWVVAAAASVALVVGLPALGLGLAAIAEPPALTAPELAAAGVLLRDSVALSLAVAFAATAIGGWMAWASSRLRVPGGALLALLALLPLGTPSYLLAATAERALFHPLGPLSGLRGLPAAFVVLTVVTAPVVQLIVAAALARSSASEEEAARSLGAGPGRVLRAVVLPRARAGLALGFVLAFVYALSDFGAVAVLDAPVLTFRLYQAVAAHDLARATLYGAALLAAAAPTLAAAAWLRGSAHAGVANPRPASPMRAGPVAVAATVAGAALLGGIGALLPVVELSRWVAEGAADGRLRFGGVWAPLGASIGVSAVAAAVTLALALAPAWVAARGRGGWLRQAAWLASALPGPLLAFGWILAALLVARAGILPYGPLMTSGALLLLGYATRFLAEAAAPLEDGVLHLDPRQEAAARALGASRVRWGVRVAGPALAPGIAAAYALVFVAILKELPITLLLGGPSGVRTLAFRVFDRYNEALFADAGVAGLTLLAVALAALTLTLRRR